MTDKINYELGILAFGSLINDPGQEILDVENCRIDCETPFNVEFARKSSTRSNAPTLIPVEQGGKKVKAKIIVLNITNMADAENILYRRETDKIGQQDTYNYPDNPTSNQVKRNVKVGIIFNFKGVRNVLYTSIGRNIEEELTGELLACLAIESIRAEAGQKEKDGLRYLRDAKRNGIITELSSDYENQILAKTKTKSLEEAIEKLDREREDNIA